VLSVDYHEEEPEVVSHVISIELIRAEVGLGPPTLWI